MNDMIICIGRQYGSGGREIGEKLAAELLKTFLSLSFDPNSSSAPKVACYRAYDQSR